MILILHGNYYQLVCTLKKKAYEIGTLPFTCTVKPVVLRVASEILRSSPGVLRLSLDNPL